MSRKVGLWLIGAYGGVSSTLAVGLAALKKGLVDNCGLVSALPHFRHLDFVDWNDVALGGHDIRQSSCIEEAKVLCRGYNPVISPEIVEKTTDELQSLQAAIRPGILFNSGPAIQSLSSSEFAVSPDSCHSAIEKIRSDLNQFKQKQGCESVIVVNVASTEPAVDVTGIPDQWSELEKLIASGEANQLPSSSLYAIAAIGNGMPFVNFTPSLGNDLTAIHDLANISKTCHMGNDGKTGETFMKSVLAPAFEHRNLNIMSWVGHNIFGNMDGQILDDPKNKETKVASKGKMLEHMLGYQPQSHISIEYIKSLGDWKTAWDHIHFQGFLGTPMTLQFTWQGCDSILAAPLVLDLFRFADLASQRGEYGLLAFLSSFFKSPMGTNEHDFSRQFDSLVEWSSQKTNSNAQ